MGTTATLKRVFRIEINKATKVEVFLVLEVRYEIMVEIFKKRPTV